MLTYFDLYSVALVLGALVLATIFLTAFDSTALVLAAFLFLGFLADVFLDVQVFIYLFLVIGLHCLRPGYPPLGVFFFFTSGIIVDHRNKISGVNTFAVIFTLFQDGVTACCCSSDSGRTLAMTCRCIGSRSGGLLAMMDWHSHGFNTRDTEIETDSPFFLSATTTFTF
jgi:hypothetical protein